VRFIDRRDAGRRLAAELEGLRGEESVVVALPRGGVPVAFEVACALDAPLDILAVRSLGDPGTSVLGAGAVAEGGIGVLDPRSAVMPCIPEATLDMVMALESRELRRRAERYRDAQPAMSVSGRTVVIVDDGLADGLTDLAAIRALRKRGAHHIIVAVPVGSSESVAMVAAEADRIVCLMVPERLIGVRMWYGDFAAVSDDQVVDLLSRRAQAQQMSPCPG
jgi:predicted phosphoribosyltransferase